MIKPKIKRKIPHCIQCRFYQGDTIVCKMFPSGPENNSCPYYAPDPDVFLNQNSSTKY
ncbi:MAG: hypothetical protein VKN72_22915 [Nostocales cyanobacterium 94392]|nr:hypothetical protein [Nostocales cyanobacterium 94392]